MWSSYDAPFASSVSCGSAGAFDVVFGALNNPIEGSATDAAHYTAAWQAPDPALESCEPLTEKEGFPYVIVGGALEFRNSGGAYFCRVLLDDPTLGAHSRCERVKPSRGERARWRAAGDVRAGLRAAQEVLLL